MQKITSDHLSIPVCYITLTYFIEVPQTRKVDFLRKIVINFNYIIKRLFGKLIK
jgi:hypothetical protein